MTDYGLRDYGDTAHWERIEDELRLRFADESTPWYLDRALREACRRIARAEDLNNGLADALRAVLVAPGTASTKMAHRVLACRDRLVNAERERAGGEG